MNPPEIKVVLSPEALAAEAAQRITLAASRAIDEQNAFSIALSGGSTPKSLFKLLAGEPYRTAIDWARVGVFFVDERCVPPTHADSNYRMAQEELLSKLPIPGDNVYRMRGEIDPEAAAREYGLMLQEQFGEEGGVDMALIGMGADGHTASLFPGTPAVTEVKHRVVANYAEHSTTGKSWRITMTAPFINRSRQVLALVAGADKAKRVAEVLEGPRDPLRLPIQLIAPELGQMTWILDADAAAMNEA